MSTLAYWSAMVATSCWLVAARRAFMRDLRRARAFRPRHNLQTASKLPHWSTPSAGRDRVNSPYVESPARPASRHLADPPPWLDRVARMPSILVESAPWRQGTGRRVALAPAPGSSWFWRPASA